MPKAMPPNAPADSVVMDGFDKQNQRGENQRRPTCPVSQGKAEKKDRRAKAGVTFAPGFQLFDAPLNAAKMAFERLLAGEDGRCHAKKTSQVPTPVRLARGFI